MLTRAGRTTATTATTAVVGHGAGDVAGATCSSIATRGTRTRKTDTAGSATSTTTGLGACSVRRIASRVSEPGRADTRTAGVETAGRFRTGAASAASLCVSAGGVRRASLSTWFGGDGHESGSGRIEVGSRRRPSFVGQHVHVLCRGGEGVRHLLDDLTSTSGALPGRSREATVSSGTHDEHPHRGDPERLGPRGASSAGARELDDTIRSDVGDHDAVIRVTSGSVVVRHRAVTIGNGDCDCVGHVGGDGCHHADAEQAGGDDESERTTGERRDAHASTVGVTLFPRNESHAENIFFIPSSRSRQQLAHALTTTTRARAPWAVR